nr:AMP-binding protein [Alkalihalobacillus sp. CinArs1]
MERRANLFPNDCALIDGVSREEWTYKQLNDKAIQLAAFLQKNDVGKGDRVLVLAHNSLDMFALLFACKKTGSVFVPINWRLSNKEIAELVEDSDPSLLIFDRHTNELAKICVDHMLLCVSFEQAMVKDGICPLSLTEVTEDDPWMMIYTGGTTGKSKGAVLSYRSVNWNAFNTVMSWGLTQKETTLTYLPMFHTGGLNALSIPILMAGGTVIVADKFSPDAAITLLHDFKCTIVLFVPTMYHMIVTDPIFDRVSFDSVDVFLSGGAPCPEYIYEKFSERGLAFKEGYGLTEAGPNNFYIHPRDSAAKRGSVGKPMLFNEVKIVTEKGEEAGVGEVGELLIRGNHMFKEYFRNEDATRKAVQNGWLHTGDMAKRDQDGDYYIVGRKKEMIISGGENIYPVEIENALLRYPAVDEAAVIGIEDEKWGQKSVAYISSHSLVDIDLLKAFLKQLLAAYKVPMDIHVTKELPKTSVGKIDRVKLVQQACNQVNVTNMDV